MIFYFTATGNSLYEARLLTENPISIPQALKGRELKFSDESIGIVAPVYAGELPKIVREFLEKSTFQTDYFYMVLTYGNDDTVAARWSADFAAQCGVHVDYVHTIRMVDNYLPAFDMNEQSAKEHQIEHEIDTVKSAVQNRARHIPKAGLRSKMLYKTVQHMFAQHPERINGSAIAITDRCVACGVCTRVCPRGLYVLENGKATRTQNSCDFCLACVHHCPSKAIGLTPSERNPEARFRNEHVSLEDIIAANHQL